MRATAPFSHFCRILCYLLALGSSLQASLNIHLQIPAVAGESTALDFDGWTDLLGVSHGGSSAITLDGSGGTAGNFTAKALTLKMKMSAAHPYIAARVANGQPVPEMRLQMVRPNGGGTSSVVVDYVFYDVYFESANTRANENQQIDSEITFFYSSIEWSVVQFSNTGAAQSFITISHDEINNAASLASMAGSIPTGNSSGGGGVTVDTDSDDMPNNWENTYGLDPNSDTDRDTDLDGDGFSNYFEFLAGTIPNDSTDFLKITMMTLPQGMQQAQLEWRSVNGKIYQVQRAIGGLSTADWQTLGEVTADAGSTSNYTLPATTGSEVFYRVRLKPAQ